MVKNISSDLNLKFDDFAAGQRIRTHGRTVVDADIRLYMGATGTEHPIHSDEEFCEAHPMVKGVCAPGPLVLSIVDGLLTSGLSRRIAVVMNYGHDKVRYIQPVYKHDTIHVEAEICDCRIKDDSYGLVVLEVRALNQHGQAVLFDRHVWIVGR